MNPRRPRPVVREVVKWAWLGLARGQIDKNIRHSILLEVGTHAWLLGLYETQQEIRESNYNKSALHRLHIQLRYAVMQALDHWVSHQVPLYKYRYLRFGAWLEIWRR